MSNPADKSSASEKADSPRTEPWPSLSLWLKRGDQAFLAILSAIALVCIVVSWIARGAPQGRLIDIDRVPGAPIQFQVDVNSADWPELSTLPEVGETLAKRIVDSRAKSGPFQGVDDLQRVRGIGPKTLERIRPYVRPFPDMDATAGGSLDGKERTP